MSINNSLGSAEAAIQKKLWQMDKFNVSICQEHEKNRFLFDKKTLSLPIHVVVYQSPPFPLDFLSPYLHTFVMHFKVHSCFQALLTLIIPPPILQLPGCCRSQGFHFSHSSCFFIKGEVIPPVSTIVPFLSFVILTNSPGYIQSASFFFLCCGLFQFPLAILSYLQ